MMPLDEIPDWRERMARQDAFWDGAVLDRPVVCITIPRTPPPNPVPEPRHASLRERWLDADYQAARALASVRNTEYLGDALPFAWPNLGPEAFASFFGCGLEFGEETSWSVPMLHDWRDTDSIAFSEENPYWRALEAMTRAYLEAGRGVFYTGLSDLQANSEALAAFRDPQRLNMDLLDHPDEVRRLLYVVNARFLWVQDRYFAWLKDEGQAVTAWAGMVSSRRWYVASCDFSCMVSTPMFKDFLLPGIAEHIRYLERSLYHLDGPGALRHLDSLLAIPELSAIQWVCGAGRGRATDWLDVYRRIQAAGKGIQVWADMDEVETLTEALRPEGVWLEVRGVPNRETADSLIRRLSRWR